MTEINPSPPLWQIRQMFADEGSSEPFFARLWINLFELRDLAINARFHGEQPEQHKKDFDDLYEPVLTALQACREATKEIVRLVRDHREKVRSGSIVQFQPNAVSYSENIDRPLHQAVSKLLVNGVVAMDRSQDVTKLFGIDIGSVFTKSNNFERGMAKLRQLGHPDLERYLRTARNTWAEDFRAQRVAFEHDGWVLPPARYVVGPDHSVEFEEPTVGRVAVSSFASRSIPRLLAFVETVLVYAMKAVITNSPFGGFATIVEIPTDQRDPTIPRRFAYLPKDRPHPEWTPQYRDDDFPLD